MALSEREQQVLRDLESQLHQDDPDLAQTLQREERRLSRPSPRHIGGGVALVLIGLACSGQDLTSSNPLQIPPGLAESQGVPRESRKLPGGLHVVRPIA